MYLVEVESQNVCEEGQGPEVAPSFLLTLYWQEFKLRDLRKPARETEFSIS